MRAHVQALALGFLDISVYDIKAAALNKLVGPEDGPWRDMGLETIRLMCQKWPENWRVSCLLITPSPLLSRLSVLIGG